MSGLTLVSCLVLKLGAVAAVAADGAGADVKDVAGGGLEASDDDAGGLGTGGGVAQLLMFLRRRTQST